MVEYDKAKAIALVEYKHENAKPVNLLHSSMRAIADLGNRAMVPFFVCRYSGDFSRWTIEGVNTLGKTLWPQPKTVSEYEWVAFLCQIRGRKIPKDVAIKLVPPKTRTITITGVGVFEVEWKWHHSDYAA